jgi:hypothetical protein
VILLLFAANDVTAFAEEFAQPPKWSEEVKAVFFDDANKALSGEPPTATSETPSTTKQDSPQHAATDVWRELISPEALESAVKLAVNRIAQSAGQPARFKAGLHNECRRDLTLLGALFEVIGAYPGDVRWKSTAPQVSRMCLRTAEACAEGTDQSLGQANHTLAALEELLRGQASNVEQPATERVTPEFAPLMQVMEFVAEDELPAALGKRTQFRRSSLSVGEKAQLLATLSQVIRGEEYGYADDEVYQTHADQLRNASRELNEAAIANEFDKAVQAATAVQKACSECHANYRG